MNQKSDRLVSGRQSADLTNSRPIGRSLFNNYLEPNHTKNQKSHIVGDLQKLIKKKNHPISSNNQADWSQIFRSITPGLPKINHLSHQNPTEISNDGANNDSSRMQQNDMRDNYQSPQFNQLENDSKHIKLNTDIENKNPKVFLPMGAEEDVITFDASAQ